MKLNERIEADTYPIMESRDFYLRLHKNALVPWLILVPKTDKVELFACDLVFKSRIREAVDKVATFSQDYFRADKMNIAMIGNVVSQLHVHIIARKKEDFAFPDSVWGRSEFEDYDETQKNAIISAVKDCLADDCQINN